MTPKSGLPHTKTASSIGGGLLPKTPLVGTVSIVVKSWMPFFWFTVSESSSKSAHVCASGPYCLILYQSSFQSLHARSYHFSTAPQRCYFESRSVTFGRLCENPGTHTALLINSEDARPAARSQPRVPVGSSQCVSRLDALQVRCVAFVAVSEEQVSSTTSLRTRIW